MNYIKNIEINNFKSIRHQKIDDCRRINVFIGYPNVGKSNILEALSIFSIDESNTDFYSFIRMENFTTLFYDGDISILAKIFINNKHRFFIRFEDEVLSFIRQFGVEETSFEKVDSQHILFKKEFQLNSNNKSISNLKSEYLGEDNEIAEIKKYQFIKHLQYSNTGYSSLSYPNGNNIFNIISTNKSLRKEVSDLFKPYNLELLYDTRLQEFTISKRTESGIFSIPYTLIADTIQRLIFFKAAILSNKEKVLLFEEPEAHMFPPYISKLTSDIIYDENNNQYFIATHSPFVLNDFMEDMDKEDLSIYVVGLKDGETTIRKITVEEITEIYQYGIDLFFNLENYLKDAV